MGVGQDHGNECIQSHYYPKRNNLAHFATRFDQHGRLIGREGIRVCGLEFLAILLDC